MPWGKGNEKVGQSLTGRGTEIGAPAEKKAVETWSVLGGRVGVRNLFSGAGVGQWKSGRGHGVFEAKVVAEASLGSSVSIPHAVPTFPDCCIFAYTLHLKLSKANTASHSFGTESQRTSQCPIKSQVTNTVLERENFRNC